MNDDRDPLWDPRHERDDPELMAMRIALAPLSVASRGLAPWPLPRPIRVRRRAALVAVAMAACVLAVVVAHQYRLQWQSGLAWPVRPMAGAAGDARLAPGQRITTGHNDPTTIDVARIGRIDLSPDSSMRLIATRSRHHRAELEYGHLRARIWAPPGDFGLVDGNVEIVDLGCDFDVWKAVDGSGRLFVRSGWIAWRSGARERLVPEGFGLRFDAVRSSTPLRADAAATLVDAVDAIDRVLAAHGQRHADLDASARAVADAAADADAITLLSLLTEHPSLASGPIYARLARAWAIALDPSHRSAWAAGDRAAVDAWWDRLPQPPKRWWLHWRDALP